METIFKIIHGRINKIIMLIFVLFICNFGHAQISRTIYNFTLGNSLETSKSVLNNKGLPYSIKDSRWGLCIYIENPYFAGVRWDFMIVAFEADKAHSIVFSKSRDNLSGKSVLLEEVQHLVQNLNEKYAKYEDPRTNYSNRDGNVNINYFLCDGITNIIFQCDYEKYGSMSMSLLYMDAKTFRDKSIRKEIDDL